MLVIQVRILKLEQQSIKLKNLQTELLNSVALIHVSNNQTNIYRSISGQEIHSRAPKATYSPKFKISNPGAFLNIQSSITHL
jgi:hypothetical protein